MSLLRWLLCLRVSWTSPRGHGSGDRDPLETHRRRRSRRREGEEEEKEEEREETGEAEGGERGGEEREEV